MVGFTILYAALTSSSLSWAGAFSSYTFPGYRVGEFVIGVALAFLLREGWRPPVSLRVAGWCSIGWLAVLAVTNWYVGQLGFKMSGERGFP